MIERREEVQIKALGQHRVISKATSTEETSSVELDVQPDIIGQWATLRSGGKTDWLVVSLSQA